jgi:two-component system, NarL family, sensor histidine kinase DesK
MALRLLPADDELGYTPYLWLVYIAPFALERFWRGTSLAEGLATGIALLLFLVLYFAAYWYQGPRLLAIVAGLALLGVAFVPVNGTAAVFFIYAAILAARVGRPRVAIVAIAVILGVLGVEAWWLSLPPTAWVPVIVVGGLIGGANIHFVEMASKNATLRMARQEVEQMAQIAERERIARDLHDLLGHTLSVIVLKSELASKLTVRDPEAAAREIREVEQISRGALQQVREAVTGYRGNVASEVLRAGQALRSAGVTFEPSVERLALPTRQESVLAMAIREAVTNVVRHSGARGCRLQLHREGEAARLVIEDDGRGGLTPEGVGLSSMRERLVALGGTLERSGEGGTRLVISLPLEEAS